MVKTTVRKENIPLTIFYIAYSIELIILLIDKSAYINPIEGRLFQLTFLLCTIKLIMTKYTNKEWGFIAGFLILGAFSYFVTERNEIIRIVMFIAASKGVNLKKLLKYTFYVTLVGVIILMILSATGVLGWNYVESDFDGDGPEGVMRRYCFGLGHPNALHCMIWSLILLYIYNFFDKLRWHHFLLLTVLNTVLYYFTDSKTGGAIVYLSIMLTLIMCYGKKIRDNKYLYLTGNVIIGSGVLFSVLNSLFGVDTYTENSNNIFSVLDKYLTGRLWIANAEAPISAWSLFAKVENEAYFDMGYTRMFFWYGVIPTIVYILVIFMFVWYCYKKRNYASFIIIIMFGIYTIVEAHAVSVYIARNYILLLLFGCWSEVLCASDGKERYFYQLLRQKSKIAES